jgi:hypothetical protein
MKKYSLIYIVSMICFLVIAPSCTDMDEDFIVNDEYLWNMDDYVSLVIPEEHIQFSIKK